MLSREAVLSRHPGMLAWRKERRLACEAPGPSTERSKISSSPGSISSLADLRWGLETPRVTPSVCLPGSPCSPSCCGTVPGLVCGSAVTQALHPGASVRLRSPCEIVSWEGLSPEQQAHQTPLSPQLPPTPPISHFYLI